MRFSHAPVEKTRNLSVQVPLDDLVELQALARQTDRAVSSLVREAVKRLLAEAKTAESNDGGAVAA